MASLITPPPVNTTEQIYFETSWSILSTIGLMNVLYGSLVLGITNISPITVVPIIVSIACAVANGMCYYSFYGDYQRIPSLAAGIVADVMWLIQEAGLSFYSYQILIKILQHRDRRVFLACFWSIMAVIVLIRASILVTRALDNFRKSSSMQKLTSDLHIGYFIAIALVECVSSVFLLRVFAAAKESAVVFTWGTSLFRHLTRSTEIRLASLSLIGLTRAITYSFQNSAQKATSVASQVDRFVYTLECLFPVLLMIDILGSRLVAAEQTFETLPTQNSRQSARRQDSAVEDNTSVPNSDNTDALTSQSYFGRRKLSSSSNSSKVPLHIISSVKRVRTANSQANGSQEQCPDILQKPKNIDIAVSVNRPAEFEDIEIHEWK
ncbi:hypothetical protein V496_04212 [Pseudogymnoascus sp. VKM F-4515 (FW-2607)]|nr:hypothetical protein V496_04212 [Pseudogymnoascus sp. VKM F-4515 (FW-2607)]KFY86997.1 hypothetical protein V498_07321 [Pseudogymnoascus sp. VKM F-4517 (FW-2822)]